MPYNLVFGLDAILPLDFLIPTLRVAEDLNWTGHELSHCLEELEKLDKTRLQGVVGMYTEKGDGNDDMMRTSRPLDFKKKM